MMHNFVDGISWDSRFAMADMGDMGPQRFANFFGAPFKWDPFKGGDSRKLENARKPGSDFEGFFGGFSTQ